MDDDFDPESHQAALSEMFASLDAEVPEVIREIFHRMPWDQEFTLSNGRTARIAVFYEPESGAGGEERWSFGLDVKFDKGGPDHLEFVMRHTGGGGYAGTFARGH